MGEDNHHPLDEWARPTEPQRRFVPVPVAITALGAIALAVATLIAMQNGIVPLRWALAVPSLAVLAPFLFFVLWDMLPRTLATQLLLSSALLVVPPLYHLVICPRAAVVIRVYLAIVAGLFLLASIASLYVSFMSSGMFPVPSPFWGLAGAAVGGGGALFIRFRNDSDWRPVFWPTFAILVAGTVLGTWFWALASILTVAGEARSVASDRPYCIAGSDYAPVLSKYGLNGLSLRDRPASGMFLRFHALLVVADPSGEGLYNWSYQRERFDPLTRQKWDDIVDRDPLTMCPPRPGFLDALPWIAG